MLDFLFALGQFLCVVGLLYGLILAITYRDYIDTLRPRYDPIAGHDWLKIEVIETESLSRTSRVAHERAGTTDPSHS